MDERTTFDRLRKLARHLENVEEGTTYGTPALKVGGKMFACIPNHKSAEAKSLAVRMSFLERDLRMKAEPATYYLTPHYVNYPVVLARVTHLDDDALRELLEVGWQFVRSTSSGTPRRRRKRAPRRSE
jgi:hypothetical protein